MAHNEHIDETPPSPDSSVLQATADAGPGGMAATEVGTGGTGTGGLGREFGNARPATDLGHKQMRASLREKMFGAPSDPVRLGRFMIVKRLGQGGMGVVYSAYDPDLDRRVAIKLLRRGMLSRSTLAIERLRREAQALARLSHPNVVGVYEVGRADGQVYVVMEFVVGTTLRQWMDEEHSWQEILEVFQQAGQGLAAAHSQGLVHRDFKPDNVLVGEDERVRVLDFGLARGQEDERDDDDDDDSGIRRRSFDNGEPRKDSSSSSGGDVVLRNADTAPAPERRRRRRHHVARDSKGKFLEVALTATGALLGTPAYMSPEQHEGRRVGPASDQFSYCLALYEALYGRRPFAGDSLVELLRNLRAGAVQELPDNSKVPRWILPIVRRGLSLDPDERYPSMDALLGALGRDPARTRRQLSLGLLVAAIVLLAIGVTYSLSRGPDKAAADVCQGAERELGAVWNPLQAARIQEALVTTRQPYAEPAWRRVQAGLAQYADAWVTMHENACRAHQRGEQSSALLDTRMTCLSNRRLALESAVAVLAETDAQSLEGAVDVVIKLPAVGYCGNLEALAAEIAPPEDAAVAEQVRAMRAQMSRATALENAGRYPSAQELVQALSERAEHLQYTPIMAEIRLLQGRLDIAVGEAERAIERLQQAVALGLSTTGTSRVALEAFARYIYARGTSSRDTGDALASLFMAEALLKRLPEPAFVHALLLNNAGVVYMARRDHKRASAYFERGLAIKNRAGGVGDIELAVLPTNLALVTSDHGRREQLMVAAAVELEQVLGSVHPRTLQNRLIQGHYTLDLERARALLASTCTDYQRYHPSNRVQLTDCQYYLGFLHAELGERQRASQLLARAAGNATLDWKRELATGQSLLYGGQAEQALSVLAAALPALRKDARYWWRRKNVAEAELAMGQSLLDLGRWDEAQVVLRQAMDTFTEVVKFTRNVITRHYQARSFIALATALWPMPGDAAPVVSDEMRAQAEQLIGRAEEWYRSTGAEYPRHLGQLAEWRRARGIAAPL